MDDYTDYFTWFDDGRWIRVSARAIIFDPDRSRILIERNTGAGNAYFNFIGGGVEVDETLQECIARELQEETDARIVAARYLFVLENFIPHGAETRHSLEHYFEIDLDREKVMPKSNGVEFWWIPIDQLGNIDLRPVVVRDSIRDGSYAQASHMLLRDGKTETR